LDGTPAGGWHPEERLTPLEALRGYTRDAAFAAFREKELGALEPGYAADVTLLAADPVTCDPKNLPGLAVLGTIVGGDVVHAPRGPLAGLARPRRAFAGRLSERALAAAEAWDRRLVEDWAEDKMWKRPWGKSLAM
jgi:cytosine/adenosine deaminase-related metal-dependent hydrolase